LVASCVIVSVKVNHHCRSLERCVLANIATSLRHSTNTPIKVRVGVGRRGKPALSASERSEARAFPISVFHPLSPPPSYLHMPTLRALRVGAMSCEVMRKRQAAKLRKDTEVTHNRSSWERRAGSSVEAVRPSDHELRPSVFLLAVVELNLQFRRARDHNRANDSRATMWREV
jgi:hypothetical protein